MKDTTFKSQNLTAKAIIVLLATVILTTSLHNHQKKTHKLHSLQFQYDNKKSPTHQQHVEYEHIASIHENASINNQNNLQHKEQNVEPISNTQYFKNNLKAMNWYYGSITPSEYRVRLFVSATKNNLTSCSYAKPFVSETDLANCFNCPSDKPLYNLGKSQCEQCPDKTQFNQYIGNCTITETVNKNYSISVNGTETGGISSILEQQKNKEQQEAAKKAALQKEKLQAANNKLNGTQKGQLAKQTNLGQTTTNGTFTDGTTVNGTQDRTNQSQGGSKENQTQQNQKNQTINNETSGSQNTKTEGNTSVQGNENKKNQTATTNQMSCPEDKPNFVDGQCRPCLENQEPITYQITNQKGQVNKKIKCIQKIFETNPDAPKLIQPEWKYLQQKNQDLKIINPGRIIYTCPVNRPYLIKGVCNTCEPGQFFNVTSLSCVKQCQPSTIYIERLKMCLNGTFFTSPDSDNLIFDLRTLKDYREQIDKEMKEISYSQYCPKQKPFSIGNKCSNCPHNQPYFNIDSQQCQNCQTGRYYDNEQRTCKASYDPSLSIDRMVMNII